MKLGGVPKGIDKPLINKINEVRKSPTERISNFFLGRKNVNASRV